MAKKYETAIRTDGRRRSGKYRKNKSGGTVAAVFAIILVFVAGFLIGNSGSIPPLVGSGDQTSSGLVSSDSPVSSEPPASSQNPEDSITLPSGLHMQSPSSAEENTLKVDSIDSIFASNYIVIDRLSGEVLLEKKSTDKIFPASTTKIMTTALALQVGDLNAQLKVTSSALGLLSSDASTIGLLRNETLTLSDLLYATMLPSACDAANVIADQLGTKGFNSFVSDMVKTATAIGCEKTYFVNPSGLHSSVHFSTASDLARITSYANLNPVYRNIVSTEEYIMPATNQHTQDGWATARTTVPSAALMELLENSQIATVTGGKTGTTTKGGYSLVCTAVTKGGRELVAVISGTPYNQGKGATHRIPDMAALLAEGAKLADLKPADVLIPANGELPASITDGVESLIPETMKLVAARGLSLTKPTAETALANGTTPIFYSSTELSVQAVYYDDLKTRLLQAQQGMESEVGFLQITAGDVRPVDNIPILLVAR